MGNQPSREGLEPWTEEIPEMFRPPAGRNLVKANVDFKVAFPDDKASRWMLGLLTTANDLSISFKLWAPYMLVPLPSEPTHSLYQASHMTYFMRLVMAQVHEGWTVVNKGIAKKDPVITAACASDDIQGMLKTMREALGEDFDDPAHKPSDLFRRCRAATFHYYDDEPDSWAEQLKLIGDEPMLIAPEAAPGKPAPKSTETRYIVADEWINSRLGPVGFHNMEMHKNSLMPVAFKFLALVEKITIAYIKARGISGLSTEIVKAVNEPVGAATRFDSGNYKAGLLAGLVIAGSVGNFWRWGSGYDETGLIISTNLPSAVASQCGSALASNRPSSDSRD